LQHIHDGNIYRHSYDYYHDYQNNRSAAYNGEYGTDLDKTNNNLRYR
jgi:hypothetical protein